MYPKIQGYLKHYQTVYFLSRNSKNKLSKSGFLWPLLLVNFPLTSHHIIRSSVTMSKKQKPWHWYSTLLLYTLSFRYNWPSKNKNLCFTKSKSLVNMTDEEWLLLFEKKFQVLECFTPLAHAYGHGIERRHVFYDEMLIIVRNLTILPCVALISHAADDNVFKFRKSAFEVREITRYPIIEFFR